ncbi:hypothetical protein [Streptomyces bacillaris]|uniref:hypothetical protein n=1 Tax=Streptomyces bacillaris TaxID=68179 RepID=UPI003633813D
MTGDDQTAPPPPRSLPVPVDLVPAGDWRTEWCTTCKAWTRLAGSMLLLTPDGVSTVGSWNCCEICDDPAGQEARRV